MSQFKLELKPVSNGYLHLMSALFQLFIGIKQPIGAPPHKPDSLWWLKVVWVVEDWVDRAIVRSNGPLLDIVEFEF